MWFINWKCLHSLFHGCLQIAELKRGAEIIVCTPGRMIDMLGANSGEFTPGPRPPPPPHSCDADRMSCVWMTSVTIPCMICKISAFMNQVQFHWLNCRHYLTTFGLSHICTRQWCVSWRSGREQVGGPGVSEVPPTQSQSGPRWCALWLLLECAVYHYSVSLKCSVRFFFPFFSILHNVALVNALTHYTISKFIH